MSKRGRKPAMPDHRLRDAMMDAAAEILEEQGGLRLSAEQVRFEEVVQRAAVSRSAAYRLWPQKELFINELLERLAAPGWQGTAAFDEETQRLAADIVTGSPHRVKTVAGRRKVLEEAVRVAAHRNFEALLGDHRWNTYTALAVTISGIEDDATRQSLLSRLRESDLTFRSNMEEFYRAMTEILRLKPRPPFTQENAYSVLASMGASLVEGLALHTAVDGTVRTTRVVWNGEEWSLPALGYLGIVDLVFEPA